MAVAAGDNETSGCVDRKRREIEVPGPILGFIDTARVLGLRR